MSENLWVHFYAPTRIVLEYDLLSSVGSYVAKIGKRALVLYVPSASVLSHPGFLEKLSTIEESLNKHLQGCVTFSEFSLPATVEELDTAAYFFEQSYADVIIAFGSIETLNVAKAISTLIGNEVFAIDLLKNNQQIQHVGVPIINIPIEPTLGYELWSGFNLYDPVSGKRAYFHNSLSAPYACFYDPKLTAELENDQAARIVGSIFALSLEVLLITELSYYNDLCIQQSIRLILENAVRYYSKPYDREYSASIFMASSFLGMALQNQSVGLSWGLSLGILSVQDDINFYEVIVIIFPYLLEYFLPIEPDPFLKIANYLGLDTLTITKMEAGVKSIDFIRQMYTNLNLPSTLSSVGFSKNKIGEAVSNLTNMFANTPYLKKVNKHDLEGIILASF